MNPSDTEGYEYLEDYKKADLSRSRIRELSDRIINLRSFTNVTLSSKDPVVKLLNENSNVVILNKDQVKSINLMLITEVTILENELRELINTKQK